MKQNLIYAGSVLLLALFSIFYYAPTAWRLIFLITLVFFGGKILNSYLAGQLDFSLEESAEGEDGITLMTSKGEMMDVPILLTNRSKLPIPFLSLFSTSTLYGKKSRRIQRFSLLGQESKRIYLSYQPKKAGLYQIRVHTIRVYDWLYLTNHQKQINETIQLLVLPKVYPVAMEIRSQLRYYGEESLLEYTDEAGNDVSEILDIRLYREGDKMSKIHWKLTQRTGDVYIREYNDPVRYAVLFLLDVEGMTEAYLEAFVSISMEMAMQKCLHYISFFTPEREAVRIPISSEEDVYLLLQKLSVLMASGENVSRTHALTEEEYRDWFGSEYLVSLRLDRSLKLYRSEELIASLHGTDIEYSLSKIIIEI